MMWMTPLSIRMSRQMIFTLMLLDPTTKVPKELVTNCRGSLWIDCNRLAVMVAFVALSALVTFPGGINTPLMWAMNMVFHCVVLMTVMF